MTALWRHPNARAKLPGCRSLPRDVASNEVLSAGFERIGSAVAFLVMQAENLLQRRVAKSRADGDQARSRRESPGEARNVLIRVRIGVRQPHDGAVTDASRPLEQVACSGRLLVEAQNVKRHGPRLQQRGHGLE